MISLSQSFSLSPLNHPNITEKTSDIIQQLIEKLPICCLGKKNKQKKSMMSRKKLGVNKANVFQKHKSYISVLSLCYPF